VPPGFELENSAERVIARHANQVQIIFDLEERVAIEPPDDYLQGGWAANNPLSDFRNLTIGGRAAATGTMKTENGIAVLLAIVESEERFLRFGILAPAGQESAAKAAMSGLMRRISFLTRAQAQGIRPHRVKIHTVEKGETVFGLARRMSSGGSARDKQELFRVLNGLGPNDGLRVGQQVKLIKG
jgi:predicted Zn-dependent protease